MADLRSRFIEDYAGGLLNVSRQELSTNGEVLSQDGFLTDSTIFVEDGVGTKSGLKLGVGLAESVDPTTQNGIVNVRFADRTYTKIKDTKVFTTAIASAQAALAESVSESFKTIESAIDLIDTLLATQEGQIGGLQNLTSSITDKVDQNKDLADNYITILLKEIKNILDSIGLPGISIPEDSPNGDIIINLPDLLVPNPTTPGVKYSNNVKLGRGALGALQDGILNTAIGIESLGGLSVGSNNTALGENAGIGLVNGSNNTYIGSGAKATKPTSNNEIIIGSNTTRYIETSIDPYTRATGGLTDSINPIDKTNHDNLWNLYYFITDLIYQQVTWQDNGLTDLTIDPQSVRDSERKHGLSGFVNLESKTISKGKFVPLALILIEHIYNTARSELNTLHAFKAEAELLHENFNSRINGLQSTVEGFGSIPLRGIIMWSGIEVPYGWALCNGQPYTIEGVEEFTPDLRDKFIMSSGDKFVVNFGKKGDPVVPEHKHEITPIFPAMTETMISPNSVDYWEIPGAENISQQSVIGYQDSAFADSSNESDVLDVALKTVETTTVGVSAESDSFFKTYPPFYTLAFIMRIQ